MGSDPTPATRSSGQNVNSPAMSLGIQGQATVVNVSGRDLAVESNREYE